MKDPYQNKFKNIIRDYKDISEYSQKFDSWTLKALIVKANDDVR
jgi:hypothetical protein